MQTYLGSYYMEHRTMPKLYSLQVLGIISCLHAYTSLVGPLLTVAQYSTPRYPPDGLVPSHRTSRRALG